NLPLAMAAIGDLRSCGADIEVPLDQIASAFCVGSDRLHQDEAESLSPQLAEFRPLSPFLTGPALASKAAQIVETVRRTEHDDKDEGPARIAPLPLFSALGKEALHDLLAAFETLTVPTGHAVIREGEEEAAAYIVARGELEVSRRATDANGKPIVVARLGSGAFFGEMALLSQLPGAASVIATRPSILLVAKREDLEAVVEKHPEVAAELAAHCRRQSVANLGWASPVVLAIPPRERAALVEHFETRVFEAGDKLVEAGEEGRGLHLIVSGEIGIVAHEGGERISLATLTAGETVGEVELVLCRNSVADAIAVRPTATLFLPREEFFALVQDHPPILHGLYGIAVRRHAETNLALGAGSSAALDEAWHADISEDAAALVEPAPRATPTAGQRISPLARGTLGISRASSAPPARSPTLPPPLPPPPPPVTMASTPLPPVTSTIPGLPVPRRTTNPPAVPASVRPNEFARASSKVSSFAPLTASTSSGGEASSPFAARTLGVVALVAAAAGGIAVLATRGSQGEALPTPPPAAAHAPVAAPLPSPSPAADWTAAPVETARPTVAPRPVAPHVVTKPKVVVEPNPVFRAGDGPTHGAAPA